MDMAKIKLTQLAQHGELLDRYGARIKILGQRSLIKPDVLEAMDRACDMTAHNNKTVLNVCFPYTSRDEITTAIKSTVQEYSQPITQSQTEPHRRSRFNEERIKNTIRSQSRSDHDSNEPMRYVESQALHSPSASSPSLSSSASAENSDPDSESTLDLHAEEQSPESEHDHQIETTASSPPTSYTGSPPSKPQPQSHLQPQPSSQPQKHHYPSPELITPATITSHLFTASDPPLDLLIRTSGVERLSDFMLWQAHEDTRIVFLDVLWPEFDLWQFLPVLWEWQWRCRKEEQRRMVEARVE